MQLVRLLLLMIFNEMVVVNSTRLLRVSLFNSDGDINADGVNADVFKSNVTMNDNVFNQNDNE